ncbi:MAG: GAF domain-containing protein [Actinobacteria bacterium]|nr:GAF domain-containing protein [Actinomycetota bacterium]
MATDAHGGVPAEERLQRLVEVQQLLFDVSREIGPALELGPVLDTVLRAMRRMVDFKGGSICLVEGDEIRMVAADPPVSGDVLALRVPVGQGLAGRIVATGDAVRSDDLTTDPRVDPAVLGTGSNARSRSYIGVPLVVLGEVIGLLQVDSADPAAFTEEDVFILAGLGTQVGGAIESARRFQSVLELERLKSEFIERVSHELRTPITIMSGFATTLADQGADLTDEERDVFVRRLAAATARLRYLVEEVLTLASLDSGLTSPSRTDVTLAALLHEVVDATAAAADVDVDCPDGLTVHTDRAVLVRVLGPVVDNAVRYAGTAVVRARRVDDGVVVEVVDDGPGIPEELRPRIFDRFVRGRHTVAGMGLGLAIAQHLAGSIGASVSYEPRDRGSRFTVHVRDVAITDRR